MSYRILVVSGKRVFGCRGLNFREFIFRNCPKSLGRARGVALRAAETLLFEPFRAPHTGQINVGALFLPLFGQFQNGNSRKFGEQEKGRGF
jgi:hypothetical protein